MFHSCISRACTFPIDLGRADLEGIRCFAEGPLSRMDGRCHTGLNTVPAAKGWFPSLLPFVTSAICVLPSVCQ